MLQHGFHHVLAARGCEPTRRRRQRRDTIPVEIHRQQKHLSYDPFYRHSFALNSLASANIGRAQKLFMLSSYPIPHSLRAPRPSAWLSLSRCMVARLCLYSWTLSGSVLLPRALCSVYTPRALVGASGCDVLHAWRAIWVPKSAPVSGQYMADRSRAWAMPQSVCHDHTSGLSLSDHTVSRIWEKYFSTFLLSF